eukprot:343483-Prymnesium_polylepis.1
MCIRDRSPIGAEVPDGRRSHRWAQKSSLRSRVSLARLRPGHSFGCRCGCPGATPLRFGLRGLVDLVERVVDGVSVRLVPSLRADTLHDVHDPLDRQQLARHASEGASQVGILTTVEGRDPRDHLRWSPSLDGVEAVALDRLRFE